MALVALIGCARDGAAAAVSLSPNVVSNTYTGKITLQITGLNAGETVVVQKYLDANGDGVLDAGDFLVQQFNLTDGQAAVIGGVTNAVVPGDTDTVAGQITAQLFFQNGDFSQNLTAQYLYVVYRSASGFAPVTNLFTVTNTPYAQSFSGSVVNNGTNVPYASLILFTVRAEMI